METQLTPYQRNKVLLAHKYIKAASAILDVLDVELQMDGTTGPNPINHTADDLNRTAEHIMTWHKNGVEL